MISRRISVVIPAYNAERYIGEAIESVLGQSYPCDEILVIDDGSTDATREIARSFKDVRYIFQDNAGVSSARNRAIAEAKGDLIAFLDSDDRWLPEKIERQVEQFDERSDLGMVYTGVTLVAEDLSPLQILPAAPGDVALRNTLVLEKPYMTGVGSTGLVPVDIARKLQFDERLAPSADWAFACKLALNFEVAGISDSLVLYRQHADSQMHRDLDVVEKDMKLMLGEFFDDPGLDRGLRRLRRRAHANLYLSLAASRHKRQDWGGFVRYLGRAMIRRPDRVAAAFWRRYLGP